MRPILILFAGPNGAGKSTLFGRLLGKSSIPWVDPDGLARNRFGIEAEAHAREAFEIAEAERKRLLATGEDFGFETVFSDPFGYKIGFLKEAQRAEYRISVHYIGLASADLSILRVRQRVGVGGHSVPEEKILSRYHRSLRNLATVLAWVDEVTIYDNSSPDHPYRLIAQIQRGTLLARVAIFPEWTRPLDLERLPQATPPTLLP